jgi:hypothetical protein
MDEKKRSESGAELDDEELDDEELDGVTGGFDLPHGDRDDKDPYDPKPWLRPHKER